MANNYNFQMTPQQQMIQPTQYFPQPQGNIYLIQNSMEMANIPTGSGISAAICLSEGVMYLKMLQNGVPMFTTYNITAADSVNKEQKQTSSLEERISKLEEEISKLQPKKLQDLV